MPLNFPVHRALDLTEGLKHQIDVSCGDADTRVLDGEAKTLAVACVADTTIEPPRGVNFTAFDNRFSTICCMTRESTRTIVLLPQCLQDER